MTSKTFIKQFSELGEMYKVALDCWCRDLDYTNYMRVVTKVVIGVPDDKKLSQIIYESVCLCCQEEFDEWARETTIEALVLEDFNFNDDKEEVD